MPQNTATTVKPTQTPRKFNRKIGATTYNVAVHFSKTSRESIADKIKRLIKNEVQTAYTHK